MKNPKNTAHITETIETYLARGGFIKKCNPKLAPKNRLKKVYTRDQILAATRALKRSYHQ